MISDEDVACFAIVAHQVVETFRIGAFLNHESDVDTETLEALRCGHGIGVTTWSLSELGCHADCTIVDDVWG